MHATPLSRPGLIAIAAALAIASLGCSGGGSSSSNGTGTTALSASYASTSSASGTLLCTPSDAQTAACQGMAAGAACTLTGKDGSSIAGTCLATIDGSSVACSPNPPAPPAELVTPCQGKAAGDTCTVTGGEGDETHSGVCSLGPASTGPLACSRADDLLPHGAAACAGLANGAACTMGREDDQVSGTCMTPTGATAPVCVVACADLHGHFDCQPGGPGGDSGHHHGD